jgi:hypothetical protein
MAGDGLTAGKQGFGSESLAPPERQPDMNILVLVLAFGVRPPGAAALIGDEIFACDFENRADRDYDGWPDGWTREHSVRLPEYVRVGIVGEGQTIAAAATQPAPAEVNRILRVELDGGGAAISSPAVSISPQFSLQLSLRIRATGLKHDRAWATLTLLDSGGKTLQSIASRQVNATGEWQPIEIGPLTPDSDQAVRAVIALHLGPHGSDQDLTGSAEFDDLRLVRLPRMALMAGNSNGLYLEQAAPEFTCRVSGIRISSPEVRFELLDHMGHAVASQTLPLIENSLSTELNGSSAANGFSGQATWKPQMPGYGFYHLRASLLAGGQPESVLTSSRSLAVLRPLPAPQHSEFGWSLPAGEQPFTYGQLTALLAQAGLGWAKLPAWYNVQDAGRGERIASFAEQVSIHGIELVGVLDQPPEELRQVFREPGRLPVASVFIEPELWEPVVGPVVSRLSPRIRYWQLGDDQDTSFVGLPQVETRIAEIKRRLEQSGQEVRVGVGWRWLYPPPSGADGRQSLPFVSYHTDPALTADEMAAYLPATEAERGAVRSQRWIVLAPLPADAYGTSTRVLDLVQRMLAARIYGAAAVFVPQPFDQQYGLLNRDGSPGELFVPWRTTASLIGGAKYLGPIQLPGGSACHAFARDDRAILAIWNSHPTTERMPLGETVEQIDVWGRTVPGNSPANKEATRSVPVGPVPTFITGENAAIVEWQAALAFDSPRVASVFNVEQPIGVRIRNPFALGVSGEVRLHAPPSWGVDSRPVRFKAAVGEEVAFALPVTLLAEADSGPQPVRLDFELAAERNYRFSVYRTLQLGLEDVRIELSSKLREDGALVVEQQLINSSDRPVSFQCLLFPPGRRREIRQVINAGTGPTMATYVLPRGADLIGQRLTLRAEEIGGPRVLNHAITAEP